MYHYLAPCSQVILSASTVSSSAGRLRFRAAAAAAFDFPVALFPGPQLGVGFSWYRTTLTLPAAVTESGCDVKSTVVKLQKRYIKWS